MGDGQIVLHAQKLTSRDEAGLVACLAVAH